MAGRPVAVITHRPALPQQRVFSARIVEERIDWNRRKALLRSSAA